MSEKIDVWVVEYQYKPSAEYEILEISESDEYANDMKRQMRPEHCARVRPATLTFKEANNETP